MKAAHVKEGTQIPNVLTYPDSWGEQEYIFEREGLCSRAGCKCISGSIVCNNYDYVFFLMTLHTWYATECSNTCTCRSINPPAPQSVTLRGGGTNVSVDIVVSPGSESVNTVNRLNPQGTAGGFAGCLAGEATGWTVATLAKCCVGYYFHALTAQEAYETYGVAPYASDVIAAAATIGVCLKNM